MKTRPESKTEIKTTMMGATKAWVLVCQLLIHTNKVGGKKKAMLKHLWPETERGKCNLSNSG